MDNLTAGCVKANLKVVRIGRPEATRFDLEKYNLLEMVKDGHDEKRSQIVASLLLLVRHLLLVAMHLFLVASCY